MTAVLAGITAAQAVAGVMTVAHAATRAMERASLRTAQRPDTAEVEQLYTRLATIFPRAQVTREAEIRGASAHP